VDEKTLIRAKQVLGLFTIVLGALGFYKVYQILLYILNLQPGTLETYSSNVSQLIYIVFILAMAFVVYDRLEAQLKRKRK